MGLTFDRPSLNEALTSASSLGRVAFALGCAERLCSAAELALEEDRDAGIAAPLRDALNYLWSCLSDGRFDAQRIASHRDECEQILETTSASEQTSTAFWDQVALAVVHTLECASSGSVDHASAAAMAVYDAVDGHVIERLGIFALSKDDEVRIRQHPAIQAEISRQRADLQALLAPVPALDWQDVVSSIHSRAIAAAMSLAAFEAEPRG